MEKQKPMEVEIPKTKKHFGSMVHKTTTDKLRDMLREKCRIRVRESRQNKFDVSRAKFLENEKQWLTDVLKGELTEIELDILLEDLVLKEIIEEQYQWMIEQYEKSNDLDLTGDPRSLLVMCPICQLSELHITNHILHCNCGFQKTYNGSLRDFFLKVQSNVSSHEENCVSKLIFFLDPHESTLNVMCNTCDFLALIE